MITKRVNIRLAVIQAVTVLGYRLKVFLLSVSFLSVVGESLGQERDDDPGAGELGVPAIAGISGPGRAEDTTQQEEAKVFAPRDFFAQVLRFHPVARQAALLSENARQELRIARGEFDPKLESDFAMKEYKQDLYYRNWNTVLKVPVWIGELKGGYEQNTGSYVNPEVRTPGGGLAYAGVSVPLPISQGFFIDARRATLRQAKLFRDIAEADRVKEINKLLLSAAKDYWNWYYARNEYEMMQEAYNLADVRFRAVKERVVQGDLAAIDSVEAQTILQDRLVQLQQAQVSVANAQLLLSNYLWGEDDTPLEIPQGVVPADFDTNQRVLGEATLITLLERARQQHPELRKLNLKMDQLEVETRFRRDLLKPSIRVDYNLLSAAPVQTSEVDMAFLRNNYKLGAYFSFPLFLRKERGKLQQTIIKLEQNTFERSQAGREIENGIRAVYNELKTTEGLLQVQQSMVENYLRLRNGELQKFENGESSLFLINSRESKYIEAQIKLISLRSKYEKQKAELLWAAGLSEWEGVE
jgi:outer membrane protein TolC